MNIVYDNKTYSNFSREQLIAAGVPEAVILSAVTESVRANLAAHRWNVEVSGTSISGMDIKTDELSQSKIANALTTLQRGTVTSLDFKGASGWGTVDLATIEAIADAVALHVQNCYTAERAVDSQISLLTTLEELEAFDIGNEWEAAWNSL